MNRNISGYASMAATRYDLRRVPTGDERNYFASLTALILGIAVNFLVLLNMHLPIIRPALGFWFIVIFPSYLLFTNKAWIKCSLQERLGYSVCGTLLILMIAGFSVNEILPLVNIHRPLDPDPVLIISDVVNVSLYVIRSRYPDRARVRGSIGRYEFRLLVLASLTVVVAICGANRLNNGASGQVALVALIMVALIILLFIRWLRVIREYMMCVVMYLVSLSLLLTTSLRGWYVTGHDIQQEYLVFQLTQTHGHWSMGYLQSAYNACLSITILPTELGQILDVDSPYIFKLFFQLIFALCPVLAYGIARRYFNPGISTIAFAYFVGFPTFFTDMPFLNRQEIGLLFVAAAVSIATNRVWSWRRRQLSLAVAGLGVEVSHYSSMYVLIGTFVISLLCLYASRLVAGSHPAGPNVSPAMRRWAPGPKSPVTVGAAAALIGTIVLWGTLVTGTTGQIVEDSTNALTAGSFSLNLFGKATVSPQQSIQDLRQSSLAAESNAAQGTYLPKSAVAKAATPAIQQQQQLTQLTGIGRAAASVGIPVVALNSFARNFVAYGELLFLGIGLLRLFIVGRRRRAMVEQHFFWLAVGSVVMITGITVIPSISADYGLLRAFQQGLLFFSPIIVVGSMTVFEAIGQYRSRVGARLAACAMSIGIFLATSTIVPQLLGGNLAELNLNNSGQYYDLFYMTTQEESAVSWLGEQPGQLAFRVQATFQQRKWTFTSPNDITGSEVIGDAFPTEVRQNSWVLLGGSTIDSDTAYAFTPVTGVTTEYGYPLWLLDKYKSLVFTNGGAVIYK